MSYSDSKIMAKAASERPSETAEAGETGWHSAREALRDPAPVVVGGITGEDGHGPTPSQPLTLTVTQLRLEAARGFQPAERRASVTAAQHKMKGDGRCEICAWVPPVKSLLHAHHVIPRCRGGSDSVENIAVLCPNHHAIAHHVSPRGHRTRYYGPRTKAHLFDLIQRIETSPDGYAQAKAELKAEYVRAELARIGWRVPA